MRKLSSLNRKSFPLAREEILRNLDACASTTLSWPLSTSEVLFLEMSKTGTMLIVLPKINDFLQNRPLGSWSIFVSRTSKTQLISRKISQELLTCKIDWQITILLTDVWQDNYKRAEQRPQMFVYRLSPTKRNVWSCWLKSLTGFKLCATTRNYIQQHATGCANQHNI